MVGALGFVFFLQLESGFPGGSLEAYLEEAAGMVVPHRFPN